jgi:DNA-directed RNA polymerase subunit beta
VTKSQSLLKLDEEYHQEAALLKNKLVEKLFTLVNGKTSQGVQTNFKEDDYSKRV